MEGKDWSKRTHYCGNLRLDDVGREVTLNGWVQRRRDHGGVIFIDLRDVTGLVQVVFNPELSDQAHASAGDVRGEFVLSCRGVVRPRPEDSINPKLPTGEVEVMAEELTVIATALTPPFVEPEDVISLMDEMFAHLFGEVLGIRLETPFPRMPWHEAMDRYGTDRPDTRFGMEFRDLSGVFARSGFKVFRSALDGGGRVRGFRVDGLAAPPRRELDGLVEEAQRLGASGLVWMVRDGEGLRSPVAKFLSEEEIADVMREAELEEGEVFVLAAGMDEINPILAGMREYCARRFAPAPGESFSFVWVTDFPLFDWDEEEKRYKSNHHPFTSPSSPCLNYLEERPLEVTSDSYDMVLNGIELGGGSIRIHDAELQDRVFRLLGLSAEEAEEKFGFLLEAFRYGPPPHGGIAYGLDRIVMLMAGRDSIRDVIAFPKTQSGADLLSGAPDAIYPDQLKELRLRPT